MQDLGAIQQLLAPLEERGILVKRSREQLLADLPHFTVVEREVCCVCVVCVCVCVGGGGGGFID